eukprot:scaffold2284_cov402-Prasinococcus_capsulatus_cf.AAC.6
MSHPAATRRVELRVPGGPHGPRAGKKAWVFASLQPHTPARGRKVGELCAHTSAAGAATQHEARRARHTITTNPANNLNYAPASGQGRQAVQVAQAGTAAAATRRPVRRSDGSRCRRR